jgi:hypothetical protein
MEGSGMGPPHDPYTGRQAQYVQPQKRIPVPHIPLSPQQILGPVGEAVGHLVPKTAPQRPSVDTGRVVGIP